MNVRELSQLSNKLFNEIDNQLPEGKDDRIQVIESLIEDLEAAKEEAENDDGDEQEIEDED